MQGLSSIRPGEEVRLAGLTVLFKGWLSTTTNTLMFQGETRLGTEVTVKVARDRNLVGSGPEQLAAQARQLLATRRILGSLSPFPEILAYEGNTLVQEYIKGEDLARLAPTDERVSSIIEAAIDKLLLLSQLSYDRRASATLDQLGFLASRLSRFSAILNAACGSRLSEHLGGNDSLSSAMGVIGGWQQDPPVGLTRPLTLCVHGDFVPQNVIVTPGDKDVTFIDPRGDVFWDSETPWWDPVIELASFTLFHEIVPHLSAAADHMATDRQWRSARSFCKSATRLGIDVQHTWPNLNQELDYFVTARIVGFAAISCFYQNAHAFPDALTLVDLLPLSVRRVQSSIA